VRRGQLKQNAWKGGIAFSFPAFILAFALALAGHSSQIAMANVDHTIVKPPSFAPLRSDDRGYFVEFRVRKDNEFGHSYVVLGAFDRLGHNRRLGVVGFGTAPGARSGMATLLGAAGRVGYTNNDHAHNPVERFRVPVDRATVRKVMGAIFDMHQSWTGYQLLFRNCNTFAGAIARLIGLNVPLIDAVPPTIYVRELMRLNSAVERS